MPPCKPPRSDPGSYPYVFVRPGGGQLAELARMIDGGELRVELEAPTVSASLYESIESRHKPRP
jgi:hypothetical protein